MRVRTALTGLALTAAVVACGGSADIDPVDTIVVNDFAPLRVLDRANDVADQLENREADLEAQLGNPFEQP